MQRRSFLAGLAGIFAYRKAPAFVREVMPLRSWEWEKTASGLMVKKQRAIAQIDSLPRLLIMGSGGAILADVPMVASRAEGGVINLHNPEVTVAQHSGTIKKARLIAPGVYNLPIPVAFRDGVICTGQSVSVNFCVGMEFEPLVSNEVKAAMINAMVERLVR